uniref:Immunoglobulin V-set domain-containing protein n=1 Tax=Anabas testudineus TaxID=64144 RepID=A0A3Q1HBM2_ANATE
MFCSSSECKGEDKVIQTTGDVTATEGDAVTLNCMFETRLTAYLFWYKQEANGFLKYMTKSFSKTVDKAPEFDNDRFDAAIEDKSVPLKIQKLHVSDSAVYYYSSLMSSPITVYCKNKNVNHVICHKM